MRHTLIDASVLMLRFAASLILFMAGALKLFGWFGGLPEGVPLAGLTLIAGILEVSGSVLILSGLWTRAAAFILSGEMAFAYFIGHFPIGTFPMHNQGEAAFLLSFICFFLFAFGGGRYSVDRLLKRMHLQPTL